MGDTGSLSTGAAPALRLEHLRCF